MWGCVVVKERRYLNSGIISKRTNGRRIDGIDLLFEVFLVRVYSTSGCEDVMDRVLWVIRFYSPYLLLYLSLFPILPSRL